MNREIPITFPVRDANVVGVIHVPSTLPTLGVVIVVGGPQYRVGSHRQFILLARDLAARGIAVLRFDCRGMGDSTGEFPGFEHIEPDIAAAVDALIRQLPSIGHVVLWGLCDATTSIAELAPRDPRVSGIVLLNPWVHTEASHARARLKYYYLERLVQKDFLSKLAKGKFDPIASGLAFLRNVARAFGLSRDSSPAGGNAEPNALAQRLAVGLQRFKGPILLILSGRDLTAREFEDATRSSKQWQRILGDERVTQRHLAAADHTFSSQAWRDQIAAWTREWIEGSRSRFR